jgi:hypothetical protein
MIESCKQVFRFSRDRESCRRLELESPLSICFCAKMTLSFHPDDSITRTIGHAQSFFAVKPPLS